MTVALWLLEMEPAVAVKPLDVAPAATVTEPGTVSIPLLLDNVIAAPPAGAAAVRVTVQEDVMLLASAVGAHDKLLIAAGGCKLTAAFADAPL